MQAIDSAAKSKCYQALRLIEFFKAWPDALLMDAAKTSRVIEAHANQEIVRRGQVVDGLYVIASGELVIGVFNHDGRRYVRRYAGCGQVYGLLGMMDGKESPQFFTARVASTIIVVPKPAILAALESHPTLWWGIVHQWAGLHRTLLAGLHELAFDNLRVRLIRALLDYARQFGSIALPQTPLELRLTQDELANVLGMTRQSVSREVKRLEREGHIQVTYGGIKLKAPRELVLLLEIKDPS